MRLICSFLLGFAIFIAFAIGIVLLIPFPLVIFQNIINSQVYLQRKYDGQFPSATFYWSRIPAIQYFTFYLWNVTNPDEVVYYGATPNILEIGPYTYAESEFKDFIEFRNNDNEIFYLNNKTWIYDPSRSCDDCRYDDVVTFANSAYMSVVSLLNQQPSSPPIVGMGMDLLTIALGERPLRTVPAAGTLFEGYSDPFIDLVNSQIVTMLLNFLGNPIQIPNVSDGGFFPHYNHTCDENYTLLTGKDNPDNVALIQTWGGMTHLPWWNSEEAQDVRNSGDGTFQKPNLKTTDKLKQFQSFTCRTYNLSYSGHSGTSNGIPTLSFSIDSDSYDSIKHPGYRYENIEKVNYFPDWPCGSNVTKRYIENCNMVDCSDPDYFCSSCCNGSFINGTYLFPPGLVPQRCLPGRNILVPFGAFLSAPHFFGAPEAVTSSLIGLNPDPVKHDLGAFEINPTLGSTVNGKFRMQLSLPIYNSLSWTALSNAPNSLIPAFWLDISVATKDYALNFLYLATVTIPNVILGIGIGLVAISVIAVLVWVFLCYRRRKNSKPFQLQNNRIALNHSWSVVE